MRLGQATTRKASSAVMMMAMMIGIFGLAIIFPLSAAAVAAEQAEIDSASEDSLQRNGRATAEPEADDKLQVTIYYETLCYDSVSFITNQLAPAWEWRRDQMDLKLVPFGKAFIDDSGSKPVYYCQHGRRECELNILHGCILDNLPMEKAFPVISCLMKGIRTSFDNCMVHNVAVKNDILKCAQGERGKTLFKQYSDETNRLGSQLAFVPTVEVNGVYDEFDQNRWLYKFDQSFRHLYKQKYNRSL